MDNLANDSHTIFTNTTSRRRFIQASAATAVGAAFLAACSTKDNPPARIGTVPSTTTLPEAPVTDSTLMRTSTSLEYLLLGVYDLVAEQKMLSGSDAAVAAKMRADHQAAADAFAELTEQAGGEVYACPNERMTSVYIQPAIQAILGSKAAASALGIAEPATETPPSPDIAGDTRVLLNGLELVAAATQQAYVAMINDIDLRAQSITIGVGASRRGALWGALINPDQLVADTVLANVSTAEPATTDESTTAPTTAAPTTTAAASGGDASPPPVVHAVSASFGQLGPVEIEVGSADENGLRTKVSMETPYLNSMAYDYLGACTA